jgi:CBS domain containing-hemolysin-like protein
LYELTIIIISLLLTFYFSGTETAFISVNRVRIELWRRKKIRSAEIIADFLRQPERFIYTTLVGNNLANVAFASFATLYFHQFLSESVTWFLITGITILWGEIIPKTLFRSLADWIIRKIAPVLFIFFYLFQPIIWIVGGISRFILRLFRYSSNEMTDFFSKKDVEILIKESQNYMSMDEAENLILTRLLELKQLHVRDAMIPRTEIEALEENASLNDLVKLFQKTGLTKIPIYRKNLDDIIGVVYLKDLFLKPESIKSIVREVLFVPETKRSLSLLRNFKQKNTSIAIIIDEYGGTAGLVTTEDLIEELVGEIIDEYDEAEIHIRKIDKNIYSVNARIEPEDLKQEIGIEIPEGDYDTLAGFILNQLGHIPKREESFEYQGVKFVITRATRRKVDWVRIILP